MERPVGRSGLPRWLVWLTTLSLMVVIGVGAAIVIRPIVERHRLEQQRQQDRAEAIANLRSGELERVVAGANYVLRRYEQDAALRDKVRAMLLDEQTPQLTRNAIIKALDRVGAWGPDLGRAWIEHLQRALGDDREGRREWVADRIARDAWAGHPLMGEPAVAELLERMVLDDPSPAVRMRALRAAAALGEPHRSRLAATVIERALGDTTEPHEADDADGDAEADAGAGGESDAEAAAEAWIELHRLAWMIAAMSDEGAVSAGVPRLPGHERIAAMPVSLAETVLWAGSQSGADRGATALIMMEDEATPPLLRAFTPYALAAAPGPWWSRPLVDAAPAGPVDAEDAAAYLYAWRAVCSLPTDELLVRELVLGRLAELYAALPAVEAQDPLAAAAASRLAPYWGSAGWASVAPVLTPVGWSGEQGRRLRELATLETLPPRSVPLELGDDIEMPPIARAVALQPALDVGEAAWRETLRSSVPAVRHLGVLRAIDRLDREQLIELIKQLDRSYEDGHRMSAALLGGLVGLDSQFMRDSMAADHVWQVVHHWRLGLYMTGQPLPTDAQGLVTITDYFATTLPEAAVLWAMLHRGERAALDRLFRPLEPDAPGLRDLLVEGRFDTVLRRYLPPEAPPLWFWADRPLQRFQVDVMRTWYLVHRDRLRFDQQQRRFVLTGRP